MKYDRMQLAGSLSLGSRLKRLSDRLMQDVTEIYGAQDIPLNPSYFPLFNLLLQNGAMSVTHAAEMLGVSHPAISKLARKMISEGWMDKQTDPMDERRQQMYLTEQSEQLLDQIQPVWHQIRSYLDEFMAEQDHHLLLALNEFEEKLNKEGFVVPVQERLKSRRSVLNADIIGWQPGLKAHFQRLNQEWLDRYFNGEMTDLDHQALNQPESYYLARGGYIWFARLAGDLPETHVSQPRVMGTVALARHSDTLYEISKMGVEADIQGLGIGRKLLLTALNKARELGAEEVYLESATCLERAIQLYRNMGFTEQPYPEGQSVYPRSDIYMSLKL